MAKLLFNPAGGPTVYLELHPGLNRLGRDSSNDFQIDDPSVSLFHCEIVLADNTATVTDLRSTNGTFIDGQLVKEGELGPGQTLELGAVRLLWELPPVEISIPALPLPPAAASASFLADGSPACLNHPEVPAHLKCAKCELYFCDHCVRTLRRAGGKIMSFCPSCGAQCEVLGRRPPVARGKKFFGLLEKTLRIPFKRDRSNPD